MHNRDQIHPQDMRNLIIFIMISILLWLAYDHFVMQPKTQAMRAAQQAHAQAQKYASAAVPQPRETVLGEGTRLEIENPAVTGSLSLRGGRLDDLSLTDYYKTVEKKERTVLLSPAGTPFPRYVEYGWIAGQGASVSVPDKDTLWSVEGNRRLTPDSPVTLRWNNGQGLTFTRTIAIDAHYGFTVTQSVKNDSGRSIELFPYALVTEHGLPEEYFNLWIVHEGPIGYIGGDLIEKEYKDMHEQPREVKTGAQGWIGITEKYWLTALVPPQGENVTYRFVFTPGGAAPGAKDRYQSDIMGAGRAVASGESVSFETKIFAGAKKVSLLEDYEKEWNVPHFDLAVDFGMFYFLTRPFFFFINLFYGWVGNFGVAIIMFTVLLRFFVFPLANTSYRSFAKMRQVSPQMYELRAKYNDDKAKLQEELVNLYQREKVNPMAGCLPILIQIPIFFALFKVLSVTIEMRHAPFVGWIHDLSAPDPTTVFNLFGLIPWNPPAFLMIGAWPCLMLITMIVQRHLSPPPQDKFQAQLIAVMPYLMTFILAKFAAGLVIYWTFNNLLSVIQQYVIMRSMGVEVNIFRRPKAEEKLEEAVEHGPGVHPQLEMVEEKIEDALFGETESPSTPPKPKKKKKK